jgi:hypothetical protein
MHQFLSLRRAAGLEGLAETGGIHHRHESFCWDSGMGRRWWDIHTIFKSEVMMMQQRRLTPDVVQ